MLKQRIITALALLPIALGGFFLLDGLAFALFIGLVVTLGAWEWARLAGYNEQPARVGYAGVVALLMLLLYWLPQLAGAVLLLAVLWWLLATVMVLTYPDSASSWGGRWRRLLIGLLILLPAWQGLVVLKQWPLANWLIVAVMVLVWAADIGAYFSGKAFGKRKLAPRVSPGKSWEGFYGGLALSLAITFAVAIYRDWSVRELLLALPCVVAFLLVPDLIMRAMFARGAFTTADASAAAQTLSAYALGLIPFVTIRSATATFLARGDTTTPVISSLIAAAVNVGFKFLLMDTLAQVGLALATSIGAWINLLLVLALAWRAGHFKVDPLLRMSLLKLAAASIVLGLALWGGGWIAMRIITPSVHFHEELRLLLLAMIGLIVYGGMIAMLFGRRWLNVLRRSSPT